MPTIQFRNLPNIVIHSPFLGKFLTLYSSKVISLFIGIATLSIWTRYFSVETYATYQLYISFVELLAIGNLSGLKAVAMQSGTLKQDGNFMAATYIQVGTSVIIGILWVGIVIYRKLWEGTLFMAVPIVVVILLNQLYPLSENYLVGKGKIYTISLRDVLSKSVVFTVLLLCGFLSLNSPIQLFFIVLLSTLAFKGTIMYKAYSGLQPKPVQWDRLKFGFHLSFSELLAVVVTALQKPLVNEFGTLRDVALFSVALTFYNQIKMAILSVIPVFYPALTRYSSISEAWNRFRNKIIIFSISFFALCLLVFFLIPWIVPIVVSHKYYAAIPYAQWLILFSGLSAIPALLRSLLSAQRKIRSIYIYDVCFPVFLIIFIALLLPRYGIWGMVIARGGTILLGSILISTLVLFEIRKDIKSANNEISS